MAKVTVAYDDLEQTAIALKDVEDYITKVSTDIKKIQSDVNAVSGKHDNCFSQTIDALDNLSKAFSNYALEVEFLKNQCTNIATLFKDAEADSSKMSEQMKELLTTMAATVGLTDGFDVGSVDLEIKEHSSEVTPSKTGSYLAQRTATWNSIFADTNSDGVYDKINGTTVPSATNTLSDEELEKSTDSEGLQTSDGDTASYSGGGGTGGGGGGTGNGGSSGTRVKYKERKDSTKKDTDSKKDDKAKEEDKETVKEVEPTKDTTSDDTNNNNNDNTNNNTDSNIDNNTANNETTTTDDNANNNQNNSTETPSDTIKITTNPPQDETTYHTGGGYSENESYVPYTPADEPTDVPVTTEPENTTEGALIGEELEEDISGEIDTIVKGDDVTKIPVSNEPISTKESSGGSSVIPIAAGLSAAAAAGLGAKAYMDHKRNNNGDDVEEFDSEDWNGDESTDFDYGDSTNKQELLEDDEYVAHEDNFETEKYGARNNEELADLQ